MMRYMEEDDYLSDDYDFGVHDKSQTHKLLNGINLKDLVNGKEVVFKINKDYENNYENDVGYFDDDDDDEDGCFDTSDKLRAKRGAPFINASFQSISETMVNVDPDGYVKKEIITHGTGNVPPDHSRVEVHYNFYQEHIEEPFDSTYLRGRTSKLNLDEGQVIPGLELAIKSMKKGENSRFLIKWQVAFGQQGCPPRIGKECDILADVTLINYTEIICDDEKRRSNGEDYSVTFEQIIKEAKNYHCEGNEKFGSGDIKGAIKSYRRCVRLLNESRIANVEEEKKILQLKVKCLVNLAICQNKIGHYPQACIICKEALSIDPVNVKAIFQYGKANLHLSNLEIAEKWLLKAKKMKPEDKDINTELEKLHEKKETARLEDTLFCQRAFSKLSCDTKK